MRLRPKKKNRLERRLESQSRLTMSLHGEGLYRFRNVLKADLQLTKPSAEGLKMIGPNQTFTGDSYFKSMLGKGVSLVETLKEPEPVKPTKVLVAKKAKQVESKNMIDEKLILDQPDRVTMEGKTEQVVKTTVKKLNENKPQDSITDETLLVDDALAGVEIISE